VAELTHISRMRRAQPRAQARHSVGAERPAKGERMTNPVVPRLLSIRQASERSGLTLWTVRSLIWSGDLPVVQFSGQRKQYIDMRDLNEVIERNKSRYV